MDAIPSEHTFDYDNLPEIDDQDQAKDSTLNCEIADEVPVQERKT